MDRGVSVSVMTDWLRDVTEVERLILLAQNTKASLKQQYNRKTNDCIEAQPVLEKESAGEASGEGIKSGFSDFWTWLVGCLVISYPLYIVLIILAFILRLFGIEALESALDAVVYALIVPLTACGLDKGISVLLWPLAYSVVIALILGFLTGSSHIAGLGGRNKERKDEYDTQMEAWREREINRQRSNAAIVSSRPGLAREYNTLDKTVDKLKEKRDELYSTGFLSRDYQNFQAVAAMLGYLTSGRCVAIYGHGGIIDTFVHDQQFSLINNKLDVIINQLEDIKYSQVELYRAISETSRQLDDVNKSISAYAQQQHEDMSRLSASADRIAGCQQVNASCLSTIAAIETYEYFSH